MNGNRYEFSSGEQALVCGNVSVVVKDPLGLGRLLDNDHGFSITSFVATEDPLVFGGDVVYTPGFGEGRRQITATLDYQPSTQEQSAHTQLSFIRATLIDSGVYRPDEIISNPQEISDNTTMSLWTDSGQPIILGIYARGNAIATGGAAVTLELPETPDPASDAALTSELLLVWGVTRMTLASSVYQSEKPFEIIIGNLTSNSAAHELSVIVNSYNELIRNSKRTLPKFDLTHDEIEHLADAFMPDHTSLIYVLDQLFRKRMLEYGRTNKPGQITAKDIADELERLQS